MMQTLVIQGISEDDIDVHVLLYGDEIYNLLNKNIFSAVPTFISESDIL